MVLATGLFVAGVAPERSNHAATFQQHKELLQHRKVRKSGRPKNAKSDNYANQLKGKAAQHTKQPEQNRTGIDEELMVNRQCLCFADCCLLWRCFYLARVSCNWWWPLCPNSGKILDAREVGISSAAHHPHRPLACNRCRYQPNCDHVFRLRAWRTDERHVHVAGAL